MRAWVNFLESTNHDPQLLLSTDSILLPSVIFGVGRDKAAKCSAVWRWWESGVSYSPGSCTSSGEFRGLRRDWTVLRSRKKVTFPLLYFIYIYDRTVIVWELRWYFIQHLENLNPSPVFSFWSVAYIQTDVCKQVLLLWATEAGQLLSQNITCTASWRRKYLYNGQQYRYTMYILTEK